MRMLVTGASGAVGPRVVDALCEAGHTVRTFSMDRPHGGRRRTDDRRQTEASCGSFFAWAATQGRPWAVDR